MNGLESQRRKMLVPDYLKHFSCAGSDCEDTCCAGWKIDVDRGTYERYMSVEKEDLAARLKELVKRSENASGNVDYAYIETSSCGKCPFLNGGGLCAIQLGLGEALLSSTCAKYPRGVNVTNGRLEKWATVSCPEIAKLALLNPEGISFEESEERIDERDVANRSLSEDSHPLAPLFFELRRLAIAALQRRKAPLAERVFALGLFFEAMREADPAEARSLMNEFESGGERFFSFEKPEPLGKARHYFLGAPAESEEAYLLFLSGHEYVLENYLVNYAYKNLFPFSWGKDVFESYAMLFAHYAAAAAVLRTAASQGALSPQGAARAIQRWSKESEHSQSHLKRLFGQAQKAGCESMREIARLF